MRHRNPEAAAIAALLRSARTIAVVGLSRDPSRPSHGVARAMRAYGYRIVPVNPRIDAWQGEPAFPSLTAAASAQPPGTRIDIVDVFRRPEHVAAIVEECLRLAQSALWLQLGVIDEAAAARAQAAGLTVVMDRCILVERRALG
jgi:predicted CoA-binding protein